MKEGSHAGSETPAEATAYLGERGINSSLSHVAVPLESRHEGGSGDFALHAHSRQCSQSTPEVKAGI